jgi:DNA-directed RNA polymerase subunit RPC12/RpoP
VTVLRCTNCGKDVPARSRFEAGGICPECGEEDCLVEDDAYDPDTRELRCAECGWEIEAGVRIEWENETRVFTVDDDCPVCEAAGYAGQALEPADGVRTPRDEPDYATARAAARRLRERTVGAGIPVDVHGIARALGLTVRRGPFGHDGLLDETTIEVPERGHAPERFVIAHEVGHYELRHQGDRLKIEPEANAFASELLIPRIELVRRTRDRATLRDLASHFDVSRQAIVYALRSAKLLSRIGG